LRVPVRVMLQLLLLQLLLLQLLLLQLLLLLPATLFVVRRILFLPLQRKGQRVIGIELRCIRPTGRVCMRVCGRDRVTWHAWHPTVRDDSVGHLCGLGGLNGGCDLGGLSRFRGRSGLRGGACTQVDDTEFVVAQDCVAIDLVELLPHKLQLV
jgi:hypothetical protein